MLGDRDVTYTYDARGQMRTLTDWDNQTSQFRYDAVGRHALTLRANGLRSLYRSDNGPFTLEVNNRADKGSVSSGYIMRFKQLSVDAEYTLQTIKYTYDAASRVLGAGNLTNNNSTARAFNMLNRI